MKIFLNQTITLKQDGGVFTFTKELAGEMIENSFFGN